MNRSCADKEVWFYCHVKYLKKGVISDIASDKWVSVYKDGTTNEFCVFKPTEIWDNFLYSSMYGTVFKAYRIVEFCSFPYIVSKSKVKSLLRDYFDLKKAIAEEQTKRRYLYEYQ